MANARPAVWLLTDNKPGHSNQLKGLGNRLRVLAGASLYWIDATDVKIPLWKVLLASPPPLPSEPALPHPDLVIAAGSGTHRLLLSLRRRRRTKSLVIMKPGFPLAMINGAIIPAHDRVQPGPRILLTHGVINAITPLAKITGKQEALILIGGPSPHFTWDNEAIADQVSSLISHYPGWHWTISSSRRTPRALQDRGGVAETLQACFREGLVTPDNISEFVGAVCRPLDAGPATIHIPYRFRLEAQTQATLQVYRQVLQQSAGQP